MRSRTGLSWRESDFSICEPRVLGGFYVLGPESRGTPRVVVTRVGEGVVVWGRRKRV